MIPTDAEVIFWAVTAIVGWVGFGVFMIVAKVVWGDDE